MRRWGNFISLLLLFGVMAAVWNWRGGQSAFFLLAASGVLLLAALGTAVFSLRAVSAESRVEFDRVYAGERLRVSLRLRQTSLWPAMWLVVQETWQHRDGEKLVFRQLLFPWFRPDLTLKYELHGLRRGEYRSVGVEMQSGDLFGLVQVKRVRNSQSAFLVYPQPLELGEGLDPRTVDEQSAGAFATVWKDSGIVRNVRPYEAGDPMQRIHWKLTARTGTLQTKTFEPASSNRRVVCLDTAASSYSGAAGAKLFEAAVRAAAGVVLQALAAGSDWVQLRSSSRTEPGVAVTSVEELRIAYEWLARIVPESRADAGGDFLLHEALRLQHQDAIVWITPQSGAGYVTMLRRLRQAGRASGVVLVHAAPTMSMPHRQWKRELEELGCRFAEVRALPGEAGSRQAAVIGGAIDGIA